MGGGVHPRRYGRWRCPWRYGGGVPRWYSAAAVFAAAADPSALITADIPAGALMPAMAVITAIAVTVVHGYRGYGYGGYRGYGYGGYWARRIWV